MIKEYITEKEKELFFQGKKLPQPYIDFLNYQRNTKGLSRGGVHNLKKPVLLFILSYKNFSHYSGLKKIKKSQIHDYVIKNATPLTRENKKRLVVGLREFFRFLHFEGHLNKDYSELVPTIVTYRMASMPKGLPENIVKLLLKVPDRKTHIGRRDYALILMFVSYGIRQGQLIDLRLQDINWKNKTIHFRAVKGGRDVIVPLTLEVSEAILEYFKGGRMNAPQKYDHVFLTAGENSFAKEGQRPLGRALWYMINRRLQALGISNLATYPRGPHSLRHAFATKLINEDTPIKNISDMLGHKRIGTTFIYAKANLSKLRKLTSDWPKGGENEQ